MLSLPCVAVAVVIIRRGDVIIIIITTITTTIIIIITTTIIIVILISVGSGLNRFCNLGGRPPAPSLTSGANSVVAFPPSQQNPILPALPCSVSS